MNKSGLPFLVFMAASPAFGQGEHWFVEDDAQHAVSDATAAAILEAACEGGKVDGAVCSKCPNSDDGSWTISSLITGHFSSASSEEAIIRSESCYPQMPGVGIGMLLGKRNGKWTKLGDSLTRREACTRKKLRSGRELLICESWGYHRDGEVTHSIGTMMVEKDSLEEHELITTTDTTGSCIVPKAQRAEIRAVEFRDLNGDGLEDISITAAYGSFRMTERLHEQCMGAVDDYIHSVGKAARKYPQPPVMKIYKIQYLFDGNSYTLTPGSRDAAAVFAGTVDQTPEIPPPTSSITTASGRPLGTPGSKADAATLQDFCGAPIVNGGCTKSLHKWETAGNWTIREYRLGHFLSPTGQDAIVSAVTAGRKEFVTGLWTRKDGKWEYVANLLSVDIHDCITVHLKTGLDRLVCLDTSRSTGYRPGLWITGTINVLTGAGAELMFRELIHSANNLTYCASDRAEDDPMENSVFDKMEGGDPNRADGPDLIITARYGERPATAETERQCNAALQKKTGATFPAPRLSTVRLEYNFDGLPIKESEGVIPTAATKEKATTYFNHLNER